MAEILFVAPYPELANIVRECATDGNIDVVVGRMEEGVELALEGEKKGYQVIISRGVTCWLIKKSGVDLPVVEVSIGGYDILRAYYKAKGYQGLIGFVDTPEVIRGLTSLEEITGEKFVQYTVTDQIEDVVTGIRELKRANVQVVIGKIAMANEARKLGMEAVVITSGKEAVLQSISEAKLAMEVRKQERKKSEQVKAILDFAYDGIIALDEAGKITVFNPVAERLSGWHAQDAVGRRITEVIPKAHCQRLLNTGQPELGEILEINGAKVVANRVPIRLDGKVEGVITTFQPVDRLQSVENKVRRTLADRGHVAKYSFGNILGNSDSLKESLQLAREYAGVDSTVLIYGRTGSGKEMFAHAVHNASVRRNQPFVAINCAALPENLLESELFGYVEGAFTGARKGGKAGVFEIAHNGTLFLDEVGEMSPMLQARLLRVLEEGEIMRLGDHSILPVNVRLIAATHRDLRRMVEEGRFREDLYYRLNVLSLVVPKLKTRNRDIVMLAEHFLQEFSKKVGRRPGTFTPAAQEIMLGYAWPGNIRELRNVMERLALLAWEKEISAEHVCRALAIKSPDRLPEIPKAENLTKDNSLRGEVGLAEQRLIKQTLAECGGNKTEAAKRLGISRITLWRKVKELAELTL